MKPAGLWLILISLIAGPVSAQSIAIVRHAEKADATRDPALSAAGMERAEALTIALYGEAGASDRAGPELILTSPLRRTAMTAAPTAAAFGSTVKPIALDSGVEAHVAAILAEVRRYPESADILIVGHSNTVPLIARALGVSADDMPDCEYDRLIRVRLQKAAPPDLVVTRYGRPSVC